MSTGESWSERSPSFELPTSNTPGLNETGSGGLGAEAGGTRELETTPLCECWELRNPPPIPGPRNPQATRKSGAQVP